MLTVRLQCIDLYALKKPVLHCIESGQSLYRKRTDTCTRQLYLIANQLP